MSCAGEYRSEMVSTCVRDFFETFEWQCICIQGTVDGESIIVSTAGQYVLCCKWLRDNIGILVMTLEDSLLRAED